jgi:hypothetical protein
MEAQPQHMKALERANHVRLERAAVKRAVARGDRLASAVVMDNPFCFESCTVMELLTSQRRWGRTRARKFLMLMPNIGESKAIGSLTYRQRKYLVEQLRKMGL